MSNLHTQASLDAEEHPYTPPPRVSVQKQPAAPGSPDLCGQNGSCSAGRQPLRQASDIEQLYNEGHGDSFSSHHSLGLEPDPEGDASLYAQLGGPFDPTRTLDVDAAKWRYYTEERESLQPQGWFESCIFSLLVVLGVHRPVERIHTRRHCRQQRQQEGEQRLADGEDLEQQQQQKEGPWGDEEAPLKRPKQRRYRSLLGFPILPPRARLVRIWDVVMSVVDLTYTAYFVPISLAFDDMEGSSFNWFTVINIVGTVFYIADILMGFHTGFICSYDVKRKVVMEGHKVAEYYVRHGSFYIDSLASLPIVPELVLNTIESDTTAFKWLYVLRLLRLTRIFALLKVWGGAVFTNAISRWMLRYISTGVLYFLNLLLALTILVNLLGCIWWFVAELEGLDNSWVAATEFQTPLLQAGDPARWVASCYYALTTMTTIGYGDITPVTTAEQIVAMAFMVFSVFYFGFIISFVGDLLHGASRKARLAELLRKKLEDAETWMQDRHLSAAVQSKVRKYYVQVWASHAGINDAEYFGDLPVALRAEIVTELAGDALRHSQLFRLLNDKMRDQLASAALPVRLVAGHNLYEEGEPADSFYVLQEGEAVSQRGPYRLRRLHGPALVGQAAVFSHYVDECSRRLHTVRAVTNCTLWEFRGAHLAKLLKHNPAFLPPLCDSYLQYLADTRRRFEACGQPIPNRMYRIEQEIHAVRDKVTAKLERRKSDSFSGATPLSSLPPSPSASSPQGRSTAAAVLPPSTMGPIGITPWQGLFRPSAAAASVGGSEAVIEEEQLSDTESESSEVELDRKIPSGAPAVATPPRQPPGMPRLPHHLRHLTIRGKKAPPLFRPSPTIPEGRSVQEQQQPPPMCQTSAIPGSGTVQEQQATARQDHAAAPSPTGATQPSSGGRSARQVERAAVRLQAAGQAVTAAARQQKGTGGEAAQAGTSPSSAEAAVPAAEERRGIESELQQDSDIGPAASQQEAVRRGTGGDLQRYDSFDPAASSVEEEQVPEEEQLP